MEHDPSFVFEKTFVSTPSDVGLPFPSPSYDLPPVQPSHTNLDPRQSAVAAAAESWEPPDLSSTHTDRELVENYLRPALRSSGLQQDSKQDLLSRWHARKVNAALVNAGIPLMNPWELPGIMAGKQWRREKYYLTDYGQLCRVTKDKLETPDGFWVQVGSGSPVWASDGTANFNIIAFKKTFIWKHNSLLNPDGIKSSWIMNVYNLVNAEYLEDDLVLSHVFEASPEYIANLKWPTSVQERCSGKHFHEDIDAPFIIPLFSDFRSREEPTTMYQGPRRSRDPRLTSYMANLENLLFGDPDPDPDRSMGTENCRPTRGVSPTDNHGHKRKKKSSDVWDYFSKIYARDLEGNVC